MKRCHESTMFSRHIFPTASRRDHTPVISPFFFLPHSWNIVDCGFAGRFYDTHHRVRLQTNIFLVDKLYGICKILALIFYTRTSSVSFDIFVRTISPDFCEISSSSLRYRSSFEMKQRKVASLATIGKVEGLVQSSFVKNGFRSRNFIRSRRDAKRITLLTRRLAT